MRGLAFLKRVNGGSEDVNADVGRDRDMVVLFQDTIFERVHNAAEIQI